MAEGKRPKLTPQQLRKLFAMRVLSASGKGDKRKVSYQKPAKKEGSSAKPDFSATRAERIAAGLSRQAPGFAEGTTVGWLRERIQKARGAKTFGERLQAAGFVGKVQNKADQSPALERIARAAAKGIPERFARTRDRALGIAREINLEIDQLRKTSTRQRSSESIKKRTWELIGRKKKLVDAAKAFTDTSAWVTGKEVDPSAGRSESIVSDKLSNLLRASKRKGRP